MTESMTSNAIRRTLILTLAASLLAIAACDSPTIVEDDHFDVEGFALFEGDTQLYRYMLDDGDAPPLTLAQRVYDVVFVPLNHDGEPLPGDDDHDEEHEWRVTIGDTGILTWDPEDHGHDDDFIVFHGELTGLQAGTTTMTVCVPHEGHCDFEATVTVTVTGS